MTTLAELVELAPAPSHGYQIQRPATSGVWRFVVEIADPLAGLDVEWHDITAYYSGDRYERGAAEYQGRYRAAVATVELSADDDRLAPWNEDTSSLFGVHVDLDAGILVRAALARVAGGTTVEWNPIWTGRVETWGDASRAHGRIRTHRVTVVDLIGDLVNVAVPEQFEQPWQNRIAQILTDADWLFGHDIYGAFETTVGDVMLIPDRDEQPSAINELDVVCDPMVLSWRTRRNGRIVVHPSPGDTFHESFEDDAGYVGAAWVSPLVDEYPAGVVFSYNPDFGEIEYIVDESEPFGIERTSRAVINDITVTYPLGSYAVDSATSRARYGTKAVSFNWIIENDDAVDIMLSTRSFATLQALPLRTEIDMEGAWPALALIDHLDPVSIVHANNETGLVVTAAGRVRRIIEERTLRLGSSLNWTTTIESDIDSTSVSDPMLPVQNLSLLSVLPDMAGFSWTNPTQTVIPTETQVRLIGSSSIWMDLPYPITGMSWGALTPETQYRFEVRLVRRENGVVTNASPVRAITFTTPAAIVPNNPGPDPDGTDPGDTVVEIPDPDPECDLEWELQENDGTGWVTVLSGDRTDLVDNGDGTFDLQLVESEFDPDKLYRVRSREVCGGIAGDWLNGQPWDPPDDWEDPCTTPPALSNPPYDDEDLVLYVPKICAPDTITEAVSGIAGVKGPGFGNLLAQFADDQNIALQASDVGGLIAYGEAPQLDGLVGSKTISCRASLPEASFDVLAGAAALRITCAPATGGWRAGAFVQTAAGQATCTSDVLDFDTGYELAVTYDAETGDLNLYVDGEPANSTSFGEARNTINALPIWRVGAPPEAWVTDIAVWSKVLDLAPPFDPGSVGNLEAWYDASDTGTISSSSGLVTQWDDKSGNGRHLTASGGDRPDTGVATIGGLNVISMVAAEVLTWLSAETYLPDSATIYVVFRKTGADASIEAAPVLLNINNSGEPFDRYSSNVFGNSFIVATTGQTGFADIKAQTTACLFTWIVQKNGVSSGTHKGTEWKNGSQTNTANYTTTYNGAGHIRVGKRADGNTTFAGDIGEILIYNAAHDSTTRAAIEAALMAKWSI
jgi:hypothetical protein